MPRKKIAKWLRDQIDKLARRTIGNVEHLVPSPIAKRIEKRIVTARGRVDAYMSFWFRWSTVRILLGTALALFAVDVAFYYWKISPDPQSSVAIERRADGLVRASVERVIREGRYTYFADRYNRTPSCREEATIAREALRILRAILEAPTTGGTLSVKDIFELEFVQWAFKHLFKARSASASTLMAR
jgi:hypothetical protein